MPFQKSELNQSAVALHDTYSLFRNGMVNMVKSYDKSGNHNGWKQNFGIKDGLLPEVRASYVLVQEVVQMLQESLHKELETCIQINDIEESSEGEWKSRTATFTTKMWDGEKKLTISIASEHYDEPGWLPWRLEYATFEYKGRSITLEPTSDFPWEGEKLRELPELVKFHIGSFVRAHESAQEA